MVGKQHFDIPTTKPGAGGVGMHLNRGTHAVTKHGRTALLARMRSAKVDVRAYYAPKSARRKMAILSLTLCYGGGAIMFWLHAIYRGEQGPPIAPLWHWLLDSSLGLLALTPVLFLLLPLAQALSGRWTRQAVLVGGLFAGVTTPGPILHDRVAGAGTPLAHLAATVFGADPHVVAAHLHLVQHSGVSEALLQLAVGIPVYIMLTLMVTATLVHVESRTTRARIAEQDVADIAWSQAA